MKNTLVCLLITFSGILFAQTRSEMGFSGNSVKFTDLGSQGVIISSQQNGVVGMAMYDPAGKKLWEKKVEFKKALSYAGCASPDGTTFYMLVQGKGKAKGSEEGYTICRITTANGEMEMKEHELDIKSNPISSYATNTAFYLVTSPQTWDFERKYTYTTDLLRFDRNTLDYTSTSAEMSIEYEKDKLFWEFYKVDQTYVEGYRVVSREEGTLQLEFARFDTTGKKVFSNITELKLAQGAAVPNNTSEKTYKSVGNFVKLHTHVSSSQNGYGEYVVDLMCYAQMLYDENSNTILVYGIMGPYVAKNKAPKSDGYFVAKLDAEYKISTLLERPQESLISQSVMRDLSSAQRYCDGFIHPGNRFGLIFAGLKTDLHAIVDLSTMTQKSFTEVEMKYGGNGNRYLPDLKNMLLNNAAVVKEESRYSGSALFCNKYMQLVCIHPYSSSTSTVFVEKEK